MLENPAVIAIDQDPLGIQGTQRFTVGSVQVWTKPLAGGQLAVALLNPSAAAVPVSTTAVALGLDPAALYDVEDVWSGVTTISRGALSADVPPEAAVVWRIDPLT